jgi:hypothetical protein
MQASQFLNLQESDWSNSFEDSTFVKIKPRKPNTFKQYQNNGKKKSKSFKRNKPEDME